MVLAILRSASGPIPALRPSIFTIIALACPVDDLEKTKTGWLQMLFGMQLRLLASISNAPLGQQHMERHMPKQQSSQGLAHL